MPQQPRVFDAVDADRRTTRTGGRRAADRSLGERVAEAKREGFIEGEKAGTEKALADLATSLAALAEARRQIAEAHGRMLDTSAPEIARLAVRIAERILHAEVAAAPENMVAMVRAAIDPLGNNGTVEIRLNDGDLLRCETALGTPIRIEGAEVIGDPAIPAGGCRIRTEWGEVGAGVADQIRKVEEIFNLGPAGD